MDGGFIDDAEAVTQMVTRLDREGVNPGLLPSHVGRGSEPHGSTPNHESGSERDRYSFIFASTHRGHDQRVRVRGVEGVG